MSKVATANRYATALFELAKEQNALDQIGEELRIVKEVFSNNSQLVDVLEHPKVSIQRKKDLIQTGFSSFSPFVLNTLLLIVDRRRVTIVPDMIDEFNALFNEEKGIAEAIVYSVQPLTDEEKSTISKVFTKKMNKKELRIENAIDKSLIGGVKIQIGNRIYNGSVKAKLERIKRQLT